MNYYYYYSKKRLDQGHLHPKLEVPRLTCPGWESNPGLFGGMRALKKRSIRTAYFKLLLGTSTVLSLKTSRVLKACAFMKKMCILLKKFVFSQKCCTALMTNLYMYIEIIVQAKCVLYVLNMYNLHYVQQSASSYCLAWQVPYWPSL